MLFSRDQLQPQQAATPQVLDHGSPSAPVALVCMPWGSISHPSLAVALLKKYIQAAGFVPHLHYFNVNFAELIGLDLYEKISSRSFFQTEWFFSNALFGADGAAEIKNGWNDLQSHPAGVGLFEKLREIVEDPGELCSRIALEHVPVFIDQCLSQVDWSRYMVVGFTTTFAQSLASLLLAKRIKAKYPHVKIVIGGANVDSEMGVEFVQAFPWVDYVVHGEAEKSFPMLLENIASGHSEAKLPGVSMRQQGGVIRGDLDAIPVTDLNETPVPDYSDYIRELERADFLGKIPLTLYFESSRGCWWGAKHHCTFCGLNGTTMAFRKKDPNRVYSEIVELSSKYHCLSLSAADNILANEYFGQLLPKLKDLDTDITLFYEVKANLTREQVRTLAASGIVSIQPGIESFNSRILQLMRKGVTAIQNIQLLKWCYEFGIDPGYNVLYGFPGETPDDYKDLPEIFRAISHLRPPNFLLPVIFERFSPYFFDRDSFGLSLKAQSEYQFIFPQSRVDLDRIAYFFEGTYNRAGDPEEYIRPGQEALTMWKKYWNQKRVFCFYEKGPDYLIIHDNRPKTLNGPMQARRMQLREHMSDIYLFCDQNRSFQSVHDRVKTKLGEDIGENVVRQWLDRLVSERLMFREGDRYLSLAVRKPKNSPRRTVS